MAPTLGDLRAAARPIQVDEVPGLRLDRRDPIHDLGMRDDPIAEPLVEVLEPGALLLERAQDFAGRPRGDLAHGGGVEALAVEPAAYLVARLLGQLPGLSVVC